MSDWDYTHKQERTRGMATDTVERPDVQETYEVASCTSDLRVVAERKGAGDILIASAWSHSGVGGEIMRLHTAWLKAKPRPLTDEAVTAHAASLPQKKGRPDTKRARVELTDAYLSAVRITAGTLRGREPIVAYLRAWAWRKGLDGDLADSVLTFWLAPQCPVCHGLGQRRMANAPVLGVKCDHCHGTTKRAAPLGAAPMLDHIAYCINSWRGNTKLRLRNR